MKWEKSRWKSEKLKKSEQTGKTRSQTRVEVKSAICCPDASRDASRLPQTRSHTRPRSQKYKGICLSAQTRPHTRPVCPNAFRDASRLPKRVPTRVCT